MSYTVADLLAFIRRETPTDLPDGELIAMLNDEQREIVSDLKVPTRTIELTGIIGDFTLPQAGDIDDDGVDETLSPLYNAIDSAVLTGEWGETPLSIWTVAEATERWPGWESGRFQGPPRILIYDPANVTANLRLLPRGTSANVRLTYAIRPPELSAMTDVPFLGEFPEQHHVLAHGVLGRLAYRSSDQRYSGYFSQRDELKDRMWEDARPAPIRATRGQPPQFARGRRW